FDSLPVLEARRAAVVAERFCYRPGARGGNDGQILRRAAAACRCRLLCCAEADKKPFYYCSRFAAGHRSSVFVFVLSIAVLPQHAFRQRQSSEELSVLSVRRIEAGWLVVLLSGCLRL